MNRTTLKCYMGDTGLLVSHAFDENELATADVHARILSGDIDLNEGMLVENVVAQMLRSAGHKLYFYGSGCARTGVGVGDSDWLAGCRPSFGVRIFAGCCQAPY